jgi:hypothetical protein
MTANVWPDSTNEALVALVALVVAHVTQLASTATISSYISLAPSPPSPSLSTSSAVRSTAGSWLTVLRAPVRYFLAISLKLEDIATGDAVPSARRF